MTAKQAAEFVREVNEIADSRHLRTVPVDPSMLADYMEAVSYTEWEQEQYADEVSKFGDYISGLGVDDLVI